MNKKLILLSTIIMGLGMAQASDWCVQEEKYAIKINYVDPVPAEPVINNYYTYNNTYPVIEKAATTIKKVTCSPYEYHKSLVDGIAIGTIASAPWAFICKGFFQNVLPLPYVMDLATKQNALPRTHWFNLLDFDYPNLTTTTQAAIPLIMLVAPVIASVIVKKVYSDPLRRKLVKQEQEALDNSWINYHKPVMETAARSAAWFWTLALAIA